MIETNFKTSSVMYGDEFLSACISDLAIKSNNNNFNEDKRLK